MFSVIIPAHDEEGCIGRCLASVFAQTIGPGATTGIRVVVAANGCSDGTVAKAEEMRPLAVEAGWKLIVLDIAEGGKPNALNRAETALGLMMPGDIRVYLDADIIMEASLLAEINKILNRPDPAYATGQMVVTEAESWVTRRFMDTWRRVPFMTASGVTGAGFFAVNAAGRARWEAFPPIIADDSFVRLQFTPGERLGAEAAYFWPPVEGFWPLVRVRRRQDAGGLEIAEKYPGLIANDGKPSMRPADHLRLFLGGPVSYLVYVTVKITVRFGLRRKNQVWSRGR